jgi:hypothetical protein
MAVAVTVLLGLGFGAATALSSKPQPASFAAVAADAPATPVAADAPAAPVAADSAAPAPAAELTITTTVPAPVLAPQAVPAPKLVVKPKPAPTSTTTVTVPAPQPAPKLVVTPPPAPAAPVLTTTTTILKAVVPLCAKPAAGGINLAGMSPAEIAAQLAAVRDTLANQHTVAPGTSVAPAPCQTAYDAGQSLQQACGAEPVPESIDLTGLTIDQIKTRLKLAKSNNDLRMAGYNTCTLWYYTGTWQ